MDKNVAYERFYWISEEITRILKKMQLVEGEEYVLLKRQEDCLRRQSSIVRASLYRIAINHAIAVAANANEPVFLIDTGTWDDPDYAAVLESDYDGLDAIHVLRYVTPDSIAV